MVSSKQNDTNIDDKEQERQKGDIKARRESKSTRKKKTKKKQDMTPPQEGNAAGKEAPKPWILLRCSSQRMRAQTEQSKSQPRPNPTRCKCNSTGMSNAPVETKKKSATKENQT